MENRNVTAKYQDFAADYHTGMDRAQLCAKYVIPEDRFESFLRYLMRNGILDEDPPPPPTPGQDASSPPATQIPSAAGEDITVGPKMLNVPRRIASKHPRLLWSYAITLSITIVLILIGSPGLTRSLWKHRTEYKVLTSNDAKLYLSSRNPAEVYVDITANGRSFRYEVTRDWRNLPLDEPDHSIIRIEDQTRLKSVDLSLVSAHDVGDVQARIRATKCYIESLNRPVKESIVLAGKGIDPFWDSTVRRIASLPDCTYYGTAKKVVLELHDYKEITWKGYMMKGMTTLLTVHADIIVIPLSWVVMILFFMFSSRIT